ncbi:MAG: glutamate-5-semialdehyde dehydrogenase [Myxococcota bacterium]|nr:glutamate-5-semialdehyde dehydrogenase [Myxococcota bacterium]
MTIQALLQQTKQAARVLRRAPIETRNEALLRIADAITKNAAEILAANERDMDNASSISAALRDRLKLTPERIENMATALTEVASQQDPLGSHRELGSGRSGIRVTRRRIPLGVIGIVYEARPNVTAECAALTIKSGNAVVLRGGKEAINSNRCIAKLVQSALSASKLPPACVTFIDDTDRQSVKELLEATKYVDLLIPRGGGGLMRVVDELARVPVIRHGQGICHVFIDEHAASEMAVEIAHNAKVQRPGVCNAMETLIIHEKRLQDCLVPLAKRLADSGVSMCADSTSLRVLSENGINARIATSEDWDTEFLGLTLAIRTVGGLREACDHISEHGTHHTASIITEDQNAAEHFLADVDASCVMWNASTRFNDGGELGLGAEMGISTSKMHAYGPMSATELTTEKLVVYGSGQTRGGA